MSLLAIACAEYHKSGLVALPAIRAQKRPAIGKWKKYHTDPNRPTLIENEVWCENFKAGRYDAICLLTGRKSGNLELIDFDLGGVKFDEWAALVRAESPALFDRLVIERSQSGGMHAIYRCDELVCGNTKLAARFIETAGPGEVAIAGKNYKPLNQGGKWGVVLSLIETRGEGGLFLCAPTEGYSIEQGDLSQPPTLTADERDLLLSCAYSLNEYEPAPEPVGLPMQAQRPGDEFSERGDIRDTLRRAGWRLWQPGENEQWSRPGKSEGCSATLRAGVFYVFSSNASPFVPGKGYSAFQVYALLEHGGDFFAASNALRAMGYGASAPGVQLPSEPDPVQVIELEPEEATPPGVPEELMRVPGIIGEYIAWNLATAPRPQPTLAMGGAISLMATLAGRKICDRMGNRTNFYAIAIAESGAGKGHAMKCIAKLLHVAGAGSPDSGLIGPSHPASDAGIYSELELKPAMICQIDEFGRTLASMGSPLSQAHGIVTAFMELYSSADVIFPCKSYSKRSNPNAKTAVVPFPCVILHAATSVEAFRKGMDASTLSDGFIARMAAFEAARELPDFVQAPNLPAPASLVGAVKAWYEWQKPPSPLNPPDVIRVDETPDASELFSDFAAFCDEQARRREADWRSTCWHRALEKARRLAMVYAASRIGAGIAAGELPCVDGEAVEWATSMAKYLTDRLICLCMANVAESIFDARVQRAIRAIEGAGGKLTHGKLRDRLKLSKREFDEVIELLIDTGRIQVVQHAGTRGPKSVQYELRAGR